MSILSSTCTVVGVSKISNVLLPVKLVSRCQRSQHVQQRTVEPFTLCISHGMIRSRARLLDTSKVAKILNGG